MTTLQLDDIYARCVKSDKKSLTYPFTGVLFVNIMFSVSHTLPLQYVSLPSTFGLRFAYNAPKDLE